MYIISLKPKMMCCEILINLKVLYNKREMKYGTV